MQLNVSYWVVCFSVWWPSFAEAVVALDAEEPFVASGNNGMS